jgi:hypothetical protein
VTAVRSTSDTGALAEVAVAKALVSAGRSVYVPFFNAHSRVDLVYEASNGSLRRVQCKSARLTRDVVTFYTCSHTGGIERGYDGDADEFGVYCADTNAVYLVPVADVPSRLARLRIAPPRNNQMRRVRWAEPYRLGPPW